MEPRPKLDSSSVRVMLGVVLVVLTATAGLVCATTGTAGAVTRIRKPGPPIELTLVEIGNTDTIAISWSPPVSDGGSPISAYRVENQHGINECDVTTGPTSCTMPVPPGGKSKTTVIVRAVNAVGAGKAARARLTTYGRPNCSYFGPNANLQYCNLEGADLAGLNLSYSLMTHADLSGADLSGANLDSAQMDYADLSGADLSNAIIGQLLGATNDSAKLGGANLTNANLSGAQCFCQFSGANLTDAILTGATLNTLANGANFTGANLTNANLTGSFLYVGNPPPVPGPNTAILTSVVWSNTTCPDGTNSDADGETCDNNLGPGAPG